MIESCNVGFVDRKIIDNYKIERVFWLNRILKRKHVMESHMHQLESIILEEVIARSI